MFDYEGYQIYEEEREGRTIYSLETPSGLATIESRSFIALVEAINKLSNLKKTASGVSSETNN